MEILLDVDGVLADFVGGIQQTLGRMVEIRHWDFREDLSAHDSALVLEAMDTSFFWKSLEPIHGTVEAVRTMRRLGHKVVYVTTPWKGCEHWRSIRLGWLCWHFDVENPDDEIKLRRDKSWVNGDIFVDDKPENVEAWQRVHPKGLALLMDAPYNQEGTLRRISSLGEVLELLEDSK